MTVEETFNGWERGIVTNVFLDSNFYPNGIIEVSLLTGPAIVCEFLGWNPIKNQICWVKELTPGAYLAAGFVTEPGWPGPWGAPWGLVSGIFSQTTDITGITTPATGAIWTQNLYLNGQRAYKVRAQGSMEPNGADAQFQVRLKIDGVIVQSRNTQVRLANNKVGYDFTHLVNYDGTLTTGVRTLLVEAGRSGADANTWIHRSTATSPAIFWVEDIGPTVYNTVLSDPTVTS